MKINVIGTGGHAKVVYHVACDHENYEFEFYDDAIKEDLFLDKYKINHTKNLQNNSEINGVIAIGDNRDRKKTSQKFNEITWKSFIHPNAIVHPTASIGRGSVVMEGAIIRPYCTIGDHVIINAGAILGHDCTVGSFTHISLGSILGGTIKVGEGVFIGLGSKIIQGIKVGPWSVVGAGSVVIKDVPEKTLALGVPAIIKKKLEDE